MWKIVECTWLSIVADIYIIWYHWVLDWLFFFFQISWSEKKVMHSVFMLLDVASTFWITPLHTHQFCPFALNKEFQCSVVWFGCFFFCWSMLGLWLQAYVVTYFFCRDLLMTCTHSLMVDWTKLKGYQGTVSRMHASRFNRGIGEYPIERRGLGRGVEGC